MKKYFLLIAILFISTSCLAEAEKSSTATNAVDEKGALANRLESFSNLKKLGHGLILYANDNDINYPAELNGFKPYFEDEENALAWIEENVKYLGKGLKVTAPANTPIAYDKVMHRNIYSTGTVVLFNDCHVEFIKKDELKKYDISSQKIMVEVKIVHAEKELLDEFLKIDDSNAQALTLNDEQVEKLLEATKNSADSNVIHAPKLLVWDREDGTVSALRDIMYIKDYLPAKDDKSKPEPITETVQAGIELNVRPEITTCNGQEQIMLDVNMVSTDIEVKQFKKNGNIIEAPMIDSVHLAAKIAIQDGQTMVLGGTRTVTITGDLGCLSEDILMGYKPKQIEMVVLLKAKKVD
jgi:hypothetical protein